MVKALLMLALVAVLTACPAPHPAPVCDTATPPACLVPPITIRP